MRRRVSVLYYLFLSHLEAHRDAISAETQGNMRGGEAEYIGQHTVVHAWGG